ncbi:MAG: hypothetical protein SOSTV1_gp1 [Sanya orius sauteri totivirus 1]|nr:MAG: hypothetical protein SOSTV1_gp1 [Sanya orius sauteri totivirus 1]
MDRFDIDNGAIESVQGICSHPVMEAASTRISFDNNNVAPDNLSMRYIDNSIMTFTCNQNTRSLVTYLHRIDKDAVSTSRTTLRSPIPRRVRLETLVYNVVHSVNMKVELNNSDFKKLNMDDTAIRDIKSGKRFYSSCRGTCRTAFQKEELMVCTLGELQKAKSIVELNNITPASYIDGEPQFMRKLEKHKPHLTSAEDLNIMGFDRISLTVDDYPTNPDTTYESRGIKTVPSETGSTLDGFHAVEDEEDEVDLPKVAPEDGSQDVPSGEPKTDAKDPSPSPPKFYPVYADILPVRVCSVTSTLLNSKLTPQYCELYASVLTKLNDQAGAGMNLNLVHGWASRDSNAMISIVKSLSRTVDSFLEEAALVRIGALAMSLEITIFKNDPVKARFIRRATFDRSSDTSTKIVICSSMTKHIKSSKFIVTTPDVLGQYLMNKTPRALNDHFPYNTIDKTWTVIPVRVGFLNSRNLIAYAASFLDSRLWSGSVNWISDVNYKDKSGNTQNFVFNGMPAVNSVIIPGPHNFMLVLVDQTGSYCPRDVKIGEVNIPVWNNINTEPAPQDFLPIWNGFYANGKLETIKDACIATWNEIGSHMASLDTVGRACAVLSDLNIRYSYGIGKQKWEKSGEAKGCWTVGGGPLVSETTNPLHTIESRDFLAGAVGASNVDARKRMIGYNFGLLSPSMQYTASLHAAARFKEADLGTLVVFDHAEDIIASKRFFNPQYRLHTCTSLYRLGIVLGLLETTHLTVPVSTAGGLQNFITNNAVLMSMAVSAMLISSRMTANAFNLSDRLMEEVVKDNVRFIIDQAFVQLIYPQDIGLLARSTEEWAWNCVDDYYDEDIGSESWQFFTPLSSPAMIQWWSKVDKLAVSAYLTPDVMRRRNALGNIKTLLALNLAKASPQDSIVASMSFDIATLPIQMYVSTPDTATERGTVWAEDESYPTCITQLYENLMSRNVFVTKSIISATKLPAYMDGRESQIHIVGSPMATKTSVAWFRVSDLILPDPISWANFLEKARNYVLAPIVQGGLGYLAGGPAGAAIGAAAALADSVAKDLAPSKSKTIIQELGQVGKAIHQDVQSQALTKSAPLTASEVLDAGINRLHRGPDQEPEPPKRTDKPE